MAAIRKRDGYDWKFEAEEQQRRVAKLEAQAARMEDMLQAAWCFLDGWSFGDDDMQAEADALKDEISAMQKSKA